jgi:hypothetical protein
MPDHDDGITLKTILDHMQNMQRTLLNEIAKLGSRVGGVEIRMDRLETRIDRMETNLTAQIDGIDKRLDAIEIETLPQRVKAIEKALAIR